MSGKAYFGKDDILPDFLKGNNSADVLRGLEKNAEKTSAKTSTSTARELENSFKYTGSGKNVSKYLRRARKINNSAKTASRIKKVAPFSLILISLIAIIVVMLSLVSSLGDQIETLITRSTDTMFGSYSENTLRISEELLEGKRGEFPEYYKNRLEGQGILVSASGDGYNLSFRGNTITADNLRETYKSDVDFREAFTKAKRGRTANFFDMSAAFAFGRLGISRNLYHNYKQTGDADTDTKNYKKVQTDLFEDSTHVGINTVTEEPVIDEETGKPVIDEETGEPVMQKVETGDDIRNTVDGDAKASAKTFLTNTAGRAADTMNIGCAALKVANMISVTVAAAEIYQAINYFTSGVENISKTKAGYGEAAGMNYLLNFLNEPVTTTYTDAETGEEKEIYGAPIEAQGFTNVLAGANPNTNQTKNYSVEAAFMTSGLAIGLSVANNKLCGGLRAAGATISLAIGALSGGLLKSFVSLAKTTIINVAMQQTIVGMLSVMIPQIASALFENRAETLAGIPAGETFVKGAALGNKKVARSSSGQMLATKDTAISYAHTSAVANAYESELGRKNHSPFDASSPDTFLGSIVSKAAAITSGSSPLRHLGSALSVVGNSISGSLLNAGGKAFADTEFSVDTELAGTSYQDVYGDPSICQNLSSINAVCDMYGAEITATYTDTMNISNDDEKYQEILSENIREAEDGAVEVIPNSLLANKIMFCDERDSPFGVYDANIANAFNISLGFGDAIPILGDAIDLVNALEDLSPESEGWATGAYCVMDKENNPYFEELTYLQHYTEDARIATQIQLDEVKNDDGVVKNPTIAYKEAYYEKNPIDTSEAGLIARYTGNTKEDAEEMLALIDYYNYIANYEPPKEEETENISFVYNNLLENEDVILPEKVEYYDLRTRSLVA